MNTDTIPEVSELCAMLDNETNSQRIAAHAGELMEAYHKRRLAECGGDVKEMVSSIQANQRDCLKLEQLLQLHTAKAVEEATAKYGELLSRARGDRLQEERLKQEAMGKVANLQKQCESLQQAASIDRTNIEWLNSERASLEKRCEALETALNDWHKLADQRSEALIKAQRQCEELDRELVACAKSCEEYGTKCRELRQQTGNLQQCASCGETKYTPVRLDSLGGYVCLSCVLKERDDLRTKVQDQRAQLERITKDWSSDMPVTITNDEATQELIKDLRTRVEKAEAAHDELQKQCEELRYSLKETEELSAHHLKERDDLRTDRDTIKLMAKYLTNEVDDLRTRAEKAEAEVANLQWDLGICSTCGGEIFHHIDEPFYDCQKCGQHGEATVIPKLQKARYELHRLQQDMRPLISWLESKLCQCDYEGCVEHRKALETFLAKHPWAKETP